MVAPNPAKKNTFSDFVNAKDKEEAALQEEKAAEAVAAAEAATSTG